MHRLLLVLLFSALASLVNASPSVTAEEKDRARDYLVETRDAFLAATTDLTPEQWAYKPAPNRWSIAEVAEHIAAAEEFLMDLVRDRVMVAPPRATPADLQEIDALVLKAIPDRTNKVQAPEPLIPSRRFGAPEEIVNAFKTTREKTLAFLEQTDGLRDHAIDSPLGHQLDAFQWILFISAHCERHTKQINEVKADAQYPRG